ncbi:DUF397 domain-containing protein [Actinoallomurus sp. NPDC052274]
MPNLEQKNSPTWTKSSRSANQGACVEVAIVLSRHQ